MTRLEFEMVFNLRGRRAFGELRGGGTDYPVRQRGSRHGGKSRRSRLDFASHSDFDVGDNRAGNFDDDDFFCANRRDNRFLAERAGNSKRPAEPSYCLFGNVSDVLYNGSLLVAGERQRFATLPCRTNFAGRSDNQRP